MLPVSLSTLFVFAAGLRAQQKSVPPSTPPARIASPEVHADHRVTFRFRDPNAKEVLWVREGAHQALPMRKDNQGVWSLTTEPLEPDIYGYSFVADGVALIDPSNPLIKPSLLNPQSLVHVTDPSLPWEIRAVPHGVVHHHFYHSSVVGDDRDYFVYTPPDYNPEASTPYPVLYLLHGYSDDASAWIAVGRAPIILDNLIAQGAARPMIVVMPLGYGEPEILAQGFAAFQHADLVRRNLDKFRAALFTEVMPQVERAYRASGDRSARAIAGLSMGGAEALYVGLNALDRFSWIGSFSAGGLGENFDSEFPSLDSKANSELRLLWVACGTEDRLIAANRKLRDWLASKGVHFTAIETPGLHTWMVWRRNLVTFVPRLFQPSGS